MKLRKIFCLVALAAMLASMLASCGTPTQISYFQDFSAGASAQISNPKEIRVMPDDKITIVVNSKDPALANLFNLPIMSRYVGGLESYVGGNQGIMGYTLDKNGEIDFPVVGKVKISGMTRREIAEHIKEILISQDLIKDPVVTVDFLNLTVSVLGEVNKPGRYKIEKDNITVLDALGMAGDLTIFGKRDRVLIMREINGKQEVYPINLCSAKEVFASPGYYLQQNDIVYVEPNDVRARQSTVNGNNVRSTSFWISLASLFTSVASVAVLIFRNVK